MEEHTSLLMGILFSRGGEGVWIARKRLLLDIDCLRDCNASRRALLRTVCPFLSP